MVTSDLPTPFWISWSFMSSNVSGTTAPTSGWQDAIPETIPGQWQWVRTTYSDGTESYSCSYMGTDGLDGSSVSIQSSSKQDGVTTLVLTDSDGSTKTLTIADGEDGDNGTPGASGYVHVAWALSADGSQGFSTSVSANKTHIGVYTDHTEADSQDYHDYSWSLIKGADGTSVITEGVWDNRYKYVNQLRKMGAQFQVDGRVAVVEGVERTAGC